MRVSKSDYEAMKKHIQAEKETIREYFQTEKELSAERKIIRIGWYIIRKRYSEFFSEQYLKGLNDNHIKTAITRAVNETYTHNSDE